MSVRCGTGTDRAGEAAEPVRDSGQGVVPESSDEAEEGPGEGLGAAVCGLGDGRHLQRPAFVGAGPPPPTSRFTGPVTPLRERDPGLLAPAPVPVHGLQHQRRGTSRGQPSVTRLQLGDGTSSRSQPLQFPDAVVAQRRRVSDRVSVVVGREPAGTVRAVFKLVCVRALLQDQWQRHRGQENHGMTL